MLPRILPALPLFLALTTVPALAQTPPSAQAPAVKKNAFKNLSALPLFDRDSVDALSGSLRGHLVRNLPPVLYEASPGWGTMTEIPNGLKWHGQGLKVRAEVSHGWRNHGTWRKIRVTAPTLQDTLIFDIRNLQNPEPGKMTFQVFVSFDARSELEQQLWRSGIKVHAGSYVARLRVKLLLDCEVTARLEPSGTLLPDAVFRLRVVRSSFSYDNLVVEHAAGLGGEAAKLFGDALKGGLDRWHPSLERELLARADDAIVKACDTREVRVSLGNLLTKRK